MDKIITLEMYFSEKVKKLSCNENTKSYIISIFKDLKRIENARLINKSITLEYSKALELYDFTKFQQLADWILFLRSIYPESVTCEEYYDSIARLSYYKCYRIVNEWKLFEELADNFPIIVNRLRDEMSL